MMPRRWRTAHASVVGTSHVKTSTPCQDAGGCQVFEAPDGNEVLLVVASDGAGTASRSDVGAMLAVRLFLDVFGTAARADPFLVTIDRAFVDDWLAGFKEAVAELAACEGHSVRDYSCTLLGAVVGPTSAAYVQIGDLAIFVGTV